jgi:hypothetical protein
MRHFRLDGCNLTGIALHLAYQEAKKAIPAPGDKLPDPVLAANGYWLVAEDGGVFSFGSAPFWGSSGGRSVASIVSFPAGQQVTTGMR